MAPPPPLLALWLWLLAGAGRALWLPPGSQPLCHFELPSEARCSLQATAIESCTIHMLPENNCFDIWKVRTNTSFSEGINFTQEVTAGEERNTIVLKLFNYKGRRFLIITMQPEETWWQVDVPEGEHNITITGLTGSLNETNPLIDPVAYEGCPPPRINYKAFRKLHRMEIFVTPLDEHMPFLADASVSVRILSTNKTNFSDCNALSTDDIKMENGSIGSTILIDGIYSTAFCFMIWVNTSDGNYRRYTCEKLENMTEPPFHPVQAAIEPPVWWVVGLVFLVMLLALSILGLRAIQKGIHCHWLQPLSKRYVLDLPKQIIYSFCQSLMNSPTQDGMRESPLNLRPGAMLSDNLHCVSNSSNFSEQTCREVQEIMNIVFDLF